MACSSDRDLETALQESFEELTTSYSSMKPKQKVAALAALGGKDVFVRLPTGYGKTIITAVLPGAFDRLQGREGKHHIVLCVSPLISLMIDQRRRLQEMGVNADILGSAQTDNSAIESIFAGRIQCVLTGPETILNNRQARDMILSRPYQEKLAAVIVDEAHCISHWLVVVCMLLHA